MSLWAKWNIMEREGVEIQNIGYWPIVIFFQTLSIHCQYEKKGTSNHRPRPLSKLLGEDQMLGKYDQDLIFCFLFIKLLDVPFLKILLSIWLSSLKKIRREYCSGKFNKKSFSLAFLLMYAIKLPKLQVVWERQGWTHLSKIEGFLLDLN